MTFTEALKALSAGHMVKRGSSTIHIQQATVPILVQGILGSAGGATPLGMDQQGNWLMCKFPCIDHAAPYAFSDAEVTATDWELFEPPQE